MSTLGLIAMTGVEVEAHAYALLDSARKLRSIRSVEDVCLLSFDPPPRWYFDEGGRWERMSLRIDMLSYCRFQVRHLHRAMRADYMLNIQADGWVTNPDKWTDEFLRYDYIGAPWKPDRTKGLRTGNSGFSLRSRRFMELSALKWEDVVNRDLYVPYDDIGDDVWWCQVNAPWFQSQGIRFAPLDVAARFSIEQTVPEWPERTPDDTLGQHARFRHVCNHPSNTPAPRTS